MRAEQKTTDGEPHLAEMGSNFVHDQLADPLGGFAASESHTGSRREEADDRCVGLRWCKISRGLVHKQVLLNYCCSLVQLKFLRRPFTHLLTLNP